MQLLFTWTVVWRCWQQILQLLEDTWAAIFRCDFCWVAKVAKTNSPMLKDIELKFEQMLRSPRKRSNSVLRSLRRCAWELFKRTVSLILLPSLVWVALTGTLQWRCWQQILQLLEDTWAAIFRCDFCWVAKVAKTNSPMLKDIELKFEQMLRSPRKRSNSVLRSLRRCAWELFKRTVSLILLPSLVWVALTGTLHWLLACVLTVQVVIPKDSQIQIPKGETI